MIPLHTAELSLELQFRECDSCGYILVVELRIHSNGPPFFPYTQVANTSTRKFATMITLFPSIRETYFGVKALLQTVAEDNAELTSLQARLNADPGVPVSNPTTSFWLKNSPFLDLVDKRSKTLPKYADIVIIGSGITGTSVARTILSECASMGINRRVVMLEARQTCSGATGRNGGHIKCTPHESFCEYKDRFGVERARALVDFQTSHLPILVDLARQESWDLAEARQVETLDVFYNEEVWLDNKRKVEEFRKGMPEGARDTFVWEKDEAHEVRFTP